MTLQCNYVPNKIIFSVTTHLVSLKYLIMNSRNAFVCLFVCLIIPIQSESLLAKALLPPSMLLVYFVLSKQRQPTETWTLQDLQRCSVGFGTKSLVDQTSPVGCEVKPMNLFVQHIPQMLNCRDLGNLESRATP